MAHHHHHDLPLLLLFMARLLRPLLLGALLLAMQAAPGAEARDEARLRAQLGALMRTKLQCNHSMHGPPKAHKHHCRHVYPHTAETLGAVDQSRAIQVIANRLTAELYVRIPIYMRRSMIGLQLSRSTTDRRKPPTASTHAGAGETTWRSSGRRRGRRRAGCSVRW